jgi:predicted ABC-type exoprotein transport system permease subunit
VTTQTRLQLKIKNPALDSTKTPSCQVGYYLINYIDKNKCDNLAKNMSIRQYLATMAFATLLGWVVWILVLFYIDPTTTESIGFWFFYISLFLSLLGTYSVIALAIKIKLVKHEEIIFRQTKKTFKQALIFSSYAIVTLFLSQRDLLNWWNFFLLTSVYLFMEGAILTNRNKRNQYVK